MVQCVAMSAVFGDSTDIHKFIQH